MCWYDRALVCYVGVGVGVGVFMFMYVLLCAGMCVGVSGCWCI